jgi:putative PIG3 family NAD(P)H quinone oxidoreductase
MKAILLNEFGGSENLVYADIDTPKPGPGQVLIKVTATSVNRPDIVQRQGNYNPPKGDSEILGLEVAGTIEQLGAEVDSWQPGQRVMALIGGGGYAEFAVAHASHLLAVPDSMTFEQAACVCETYLTAYLNLFLLGKLENHNSALLHGGGGGVNTAAIQICRHLVPDTTLYVTASSGKVERVSQLGAHHVIDYTKQPFVDEIKSRSAGKGVDVILDHIGANYFVDNMKSLAISGRLLLIGVTSGVRAELNLALMMVKRQQIIGSVLRSRPVEEKAFIIGRFREKVLPAMASGLIAPLVHKVFPLSEAGQAHQLMERSGHFGKIVLTI